MCKAIYPFMYCIFYVLHISEKFVTISEISLTYFVLRYCVELQLAVANIILPR